MTPFLDLKAATTELQKDLQKAINRVLLSGQYIGGAEVEAFEDEFSAFCGSKYTVGVGNGLDAIRLALLAVDVGPGDEVIVPSNTYIATWLAVTQCGATPVPAEPDVLTHNLDPRSFEAAITRRTKAVVPVHLYGTPADMRPILEIAERNKIRVIEDAAQAHGASCYGKLIGTHGDAVAWSFYPSKNLGAIGDGGAVTTDHADVADRIRTLRNYGSKVRYENVEKGYNSRLDPIQAAVLRVKLPHLMEWNHRRKSIAARYAEAFNDLELICPAIPEWAGPVSHLYVVRTRARDELKAKLACEGIETLIHYPIPPHRQKAYSDAQFARGAFPLANMLADEVLSLPIGPQMKNTDVESVISAVRRCSQ